MATFLSTREAFFVNILKETPFGTVPGLRKATKLPKHASIMCDLAKDNKNRGQNHTIGFLKYDIANAINLTFNNRGFSRYLKKEITGVWNSSDMQITFLQTGEYRIEGNPPQDTLLHMSHKEGQWDISRNMLFLFNRKTHSGIRSQLVDIRDSMLFLPGYDGHFHYTLKKSLHK